MSHLGAVWAIGVTAADIAWPIVLALCIAFMILPFVFLVVAVILPDAPLETGHDQRD